MCISEETCCIYVIYLDQFSPFDLPYFGLTTFTATDKWLLENSHRVVGWL